jgi:hypothetical protein
MAENSDNVANSVVLNNAATFANTQQIQWHKNSKTQHHPMHSKTQQILQNIYNLKAFTCSWKFIGFT